MSLILTTFSISARDVRDGSLGVAERANQSVEQQVRVILSTLKEHLRELTPLEPAMAWVIRHAAWTVTRFAVHEDGRTGYFSITGMNYGGELCQFGELVPLPTVSACWSSIAHTALWPPGARPLSWRPS